jgi:hypothetical protein
MESIYQTKYLVVDNFTEVHKNVIKKYFDNDISKFPFPPKYQISENTIRTPQPKNKRFLVENYSEELLEKLTKELGMKNPRKINNIKR